MTLPFNAWAQSDARPTEDQLLGRWRSTARAADGQVLTAEIELKRDPATPAQSRTDSDAVSSLSERTLVITSERTGLTTTLTRVE